MISPERNHSLGSRHQGDTTMNKIKIALAALLVLGTGSMALALEGLDGDNNPVPGASRYYSSHSHAVGYRSEESRR
jgi:hypothetical protein